MGKEDSTTRSDPENPEKRSDARTVGIDAAAAPVFGETTLDTRGSLAATSMATEHVSIGPYALLKKLGEGGMGQVWLAEQAAPVRRQVALKLIRGGLYDAAMMHRFESERQSLAIMNHPAIAKVFDAGATQDGQPYFVMEYVEGPPITQYCDNKKLNVRDRLELFIRVCEGVQHAHQKAIIHRDLKPSNILVVEVDGKPVPRVIDFGLAKATSSQPGAEQTLFTQVGGFVGTRGFMSPEQADPSVLDVDTRTDVYSLGVTLYVLLTGTLPFEVQQWNKKPFDEVLRQLREEDPPSPSAKLSAQKGTAKDSATNRGTEPRQLVSLLRGDLDWITLKAIEKDRARRYGTPLELAADIHRYLENRPVVARPASTGYRLKKYIRRHRVGVAAAGSAVVLLLAFAVTEAVQLKRTTGERDRANRITDFMIDMFKQTDPSQARGNTITAREILDKASTEVEAGLKNDPEVQAQMLDVMGKIYLNLGLYSQARPLMDRAMGIRRATFGANDRRTLSTMYALALLLDGEGHSIQAEELERKTLELQKKALGPEDPDTLKTSFSLCMTLYIQGRFAEAEKLQRTTLEIQRRVLGPEALDTLKSTRNLARTLEAQNHNAEAVEIYRQLLEVEKRVLGSDHPETVNTMSSMSVALRDTGNYGEAAKLQRQVLEGERRLYGPENSHTIEATENLGMTMLAAQQYAQAEKIFREVFEFRTRVLGSESELTLLATHSLGFAIEQQGRSKEAEELQRKALETADRVLGPNNRVTLSLMEDLSGTLADEGKLADSERQLQRLRNIRASILGPDNSNTAVATYNLACIEARMGHTSEALSLLRTAVDHGLLPRQDLDIETDTDLKSLHGDPRFAELVAHAKERASAAQKRN